MNIHYTLNVNPFNFLYTHKRFGTENLCRNFDLQVVEIHLLRITLFGIIIK